jgi:hypothetical protein
MGAGEDFGGSEMPVHEGWTIARLESRGSDGAPPTLAPMPGMALLFA